MIKEFRNAALRNAAKGSFVSNSKKNQDIRFMITHGKPDLTRPGAHEDELRRFDGAAQTVVIEPSNEENEKFADDLIDEYRVSPLES